MIRNQRLARLIASIGLAGFVRMPDIGARGVAPDLCRSVVCRFEDVQHVRDCEGRTAVVGTTLSLSILRIGDGPGLEHRPESSGVSNGEFGRRQAWEDRIGAAG